MRAISVDIAAEEECPVRCGDIFARKAVEGYSGFGQPAPLLPDFLALVVIERRQEVGEVAVTGVLPVKLQAGAHHHSCPFAFRSHLRLREKDVQRRQAFLGQKRQRAVEQAPPRFARAGDEPRPGGRRERDRRQQLRIVTPPVPPIRVGPRPVEHVFAVGMRLQIQRHRASQRVAAPQQQITGAQPVSGEAHPVSCNACRNACDSSGHAPASASQADGWIEASVSVTCSENEAMRSRLWREEAPPASSRRQLAAPARHRCVSSSCDASDRRGS